MTTGLNKWIGKRCWLPFYCSILLDLTICYFIDVFRFCWLAAGQWQWQAVLKSGLYHLNGMLHYIDGTDIEKGVRHWNGSVAVLPQYVFSLLWVMARRWSDHVKEENRERKRRWQKDGCDSHCRHFMVTVSLKCLLMSVFLRGNSSVVSVSDIIIPFDNDYII